MGTKIRTGLPAKHGFFSSFKRRGVRVRGSGKRERERGQGSGFREEGAGEGSGFREEGRCRFLWTQPLTPEP
jgi:hypothetical protein